VAARRHARQPALCGRWPAAGIKQALAMIDTEAIDVAVLDVNRNGQLTFRNASNEVRSDKYFAPKASHFLHRKRKPRLRPVLVML
jgi:hypothetical protein